MRPYIDQMRENIAQALQIDTDQVNVKATTEEGFWAYRHRVSAQAVCAVESIMKQKLPGG